MSTEKITFEMKCTKIAQNYKLSLSQYDPFPKLSEFFGGLSPKDALYTQIIEAGEEALSKEYPVIYATDFMSFKRTGNRSDYETAYFERRFILNSLVIAECLEHKGRFLDHIINGIFLICEESGWCLPAHNSYYRDKPQFILPDSSKPVLDLFACETGALLSMILYLLSPDLDAISELITSRIRDELYKRIIDPYINSHFWWMGHGNEPMCNWTTWCTTNILLCSFIKNGLDISSEIQNLIFMKSASSIDYFLKDYGVDGCCDEGAGYYRHAGLCLFSSLDILNEISEANFLSLYTTDKVRNIAAYIANVHVDGPWYFNFSDCSPKAGRSGVREFLFGKKTNQPFLCAFAAKDFYDTMQENSLLKDESYRLNLFYRTQALYHSSEVLDYHTNQKRVCETLPSNIWYESVGLLILRSEAFSLAVKAGSNDDSHNHNDTGSITVYKNGNPILVDIGVETYTAKTFSNDRYDIWTMQSGYHNLPTICGEDELPGETYRATHVELSLENSSPRNGISMHLENAFSEAISNTYFFCREVFLDTSTNEIHLSDSTNAPDAILNFISYEKPFLNPPDNGDKLLISIGDATLHISNASLMCIEELEITDARLKTAWDHNLYRMRLNMNGNAKIIMR